VGKFGKKWYEKEWQVNQKEKALSKLKRKNVIAFAYLQRKETWRGKGTQRRRYIWKTVNELVDGLRAWMQAKLVQDGMFLVGLDIVGEKLLEVNVFSPGGLHHKKIFKDVDFPKKVIEALEKKVLYAKYYRGNFDNIEMNTL